MECEAVAPLVSVCLITYNHEHFIEQSLQGVLAQETDFEFEIVVGEDRSLDDTRSIIDRYAKDSPGVFRLIYREANLGLKHNFVNTLSECRGKYIAVISGDDLWTDRSKLQNQVDFLEQNPDYVLIGNNAVAIEPDSSDGPRIINGRSQSYDFSTSDLMTYNPCIASQVVFRNNLVTEFPPVYFESTGEDRRLYLLLSRFGKCRFDISVTGAYRIHPASITQRRSNNYQGRVSLRREQVQNARRWNEYFDFEFSDEAAQVVHVNSLKMAKLAKQHRDLVTMCEAIEGIDADRLQSPFQRSAVRLVRPLATRVARQRRPPRGSADTT